MYLPDVSQASETFLISLTKKQGSVLIREEERNSLVLKKKQNSSLSFCD